MSDDDSRFDTLTVTRTGNKVRTDRSDKDAYETGVAIGAIMKLRHECKTEDTALDDVLKYVMDAIQATYKDDDTVFRKMVYAIKVEMERSERRNRLAELGALNHYFSYAPEEHRDYEDQRDLETWVDRVIAVHENAHEGNKTAKTILKDALEHARSEDML